MKWRSLWHTPLATVRTSTSRAMGLAMSTFSVVSSLWGPWKTAAFMCRTPLMSLDPECIAGRRPGAEASQSRSSQALDRSDLQKVIEIVSNACNVYRVRGDRLTDHCPSLLAGRLVHA